MKILRCLFMIWLTGTAAIATSQTDSIPESNPVIVNDTTDEEDHWNTDQVYSYSGQKLTIKNDTLICLFTDDTQPFCIPFNGVITKPYNGIWHKGVDVALNTGDTVMAAFEGKVRYAQYNKGGFGNLVIIRHPNGLETFYAHLSKLLVSVDEEVRAGTAIGLGGSTGRSTGSHLHFEMRFCDRCIDPLSIFNIQEQTLKSDSVVITAKSFNEPVTSAYHIVRKGDTLSGIAKKYHTTVSKLCKLNGISSKKILRIGMRIRVK